VQRAGGQVFEELAVDEVCPHDPAQRHELPEESVGEGGEGVVAHVER
jgi:hypothetical protein